MKEILTHKRRIDDDDDEPVILPTKCSAFLQSKLPHKLKDPGSITIPWTLRDILIDIALCDSGVEINLMSLSIFMKLGVRELEQTNSTL